MNKRIYYLAAMTFLLTLGSCGNKSQESTEAEAQDSIQVEVMEDSINYYGIYKGTIPIAEAKGSTFESTVSLNKDGSFSAHVANGKGQIDQQGQFGKEGDVIILYLTGNKLRDNVKRYYRIEQGQLRILNEKKEPLSEDDTYVLKQVDVSM